MSTRSPSRDSPWNYGVAKCAGVSPASAKTRCLVTATTLHPTRAAQPTILGPRQTWFMKGNELEIPLAVPARFVYGSGIPTVIGYDFTMPNTSSDKCASTACIGSFAQKNPAQILADGDGGDSSFMNRAPTRWTIDVSCDIKEMPGVSHMDIVTTPEAIDLLERTATGHGSTVACLD